MKTIIRIAVAASSLLLFSSLYLSVSAQSPHISTDKDTYIQGEKIKVNFSGSSGNKKDWICISRVGLPDNEAGDYDYIPQGQTQGVMTFNAPPPGKYEARGYYNYSRNGYLVSARCSFLVVDAPAKGRMSLSVGRVLDLNHPFETKLPVGKGLVYIIKEKWAMLGNVEVRIRADGQSIVVMPESGYFPYPVSAGNVRFTAATYLMRDDFRGSEEELKAGRAGEATINVKPGRAYYLRLNVVPTPAWDFFIEPVDHEEGDQLIRSGSLSVVK